MPLFRSAGSGIPIMERILVTAFEPFGKDIQNASQEVQKLLPDRIHGIHIEKLCLPVVFRTASCIAAEAAEQIRPDAIVCLGQAGGRECITPERVAVNLMDAASPDNSGFCPADVPITQNGPAAYFSTLPIREMTAAMRELDVPAQISNTAGLYVCNSVMYSMLHWTYHHCPAVPCGFIHIPYLDLQDRREGTPSLPSETAVKGITAALQMLIRC